MRISWNPMTFLWLLLPFLITITTFVQRVVGDCVTSASKSHVNFFFGQLSLRTIQGILGIPSELLDIEQTITIRNLNNRGSWKLIFFLYFFKYQNYWMETKEMLMYFSLEDKWQFWICKINFIRIEYSLYLSDLGRSKYNYLKIFSINFKCPTFSRNYKYKFNWTITMSFLILYWKANEKANWTRHHSV